MEVRLHPSIYQAWGRFRARLEQASSLFYLSLNAHHLTEKGVKWAKENIVPT